MKMISTLGLVLLISLGLAAASEAGEFAKPPSGGVPNQYLVVLDDAAMGLELGAEPEDKARVFETVAADLRRSHSVGRSSLLNRLGILIVEADAKTARRLANDHRVLLVEQDAVGSVTCPPEVGPVEMRVLRLEWSQEDGCARVGFRRSRSSGC